MSILTIIALSLGTMALIAIATFVRALIVEEREEVKGEMIARASERSSRLRMILKPIPLIPGFLKAANRTAVFLEHLGIGFWVSVGSPAAFAVAILLVKLLITQAIRAVDRRFTVKQRIGANRLALLAFRVKPLDQFINRRQELARRSNAAARIGRLHGNRKRIINKNRRKRPDVAVLSALATIRVAINNRANRFEGLGYGHPRERVRLLPQAV